MTIYFCSGHRNLTKHEFDEYYLPQFIDALSNSNYEFIVGDFRGADLTCLEYLINLVDINIITIYHMFEEPRGKFKKMATKYKIKTKGGFLSDEERDTTMTNDSDKDIIWHRSPEQIKDYNPVFISGVMKNIHRRIEKNNILKLNSI